MPRSFIVDSLMPREPDIKRLIEADFGDEADMANYTDDLPNTVLDEQNHPPDDQGSTLKR